MGISVVLMCFGGAGQASCLCMLGTRRSKDLVGGDVAHLICLAKPATPHPKALGLLACCPEVLGLSGCSLP